MACMPVLNKGLCEYEGYVSVGVRCISIGVSIRSGYVPHSRERSKGAGESAPSGAGEARRAGTACL